MMMIEDSERTATAADAAGRLGLGRALLDALESWARAAGVRRLELTVRVDNDRARRLYERAGYAVEGVRRGSLLVDGDWSTSSRSRGCCDDRRKLWPR
jgi:ribosomal protein S18 acetylase RimI-like enzyme